MRPPIEWKVPSHGMPSTACPIIWPTRSFISRAALLVKVTTRISPGRARPRLQDMRDARGQHPGLAGAGAGQHQHRAVERLDRLALLRIEAVQIGRHRRGARARGNAAGGGAIAGQIVAAELGRVGHANRLPPTLPPRASKEEPSWAGLWAYRAFAPGLTALSTRRPTVLVRLTNSSRPSAGRSPELSCPTRIGLPDDATASAAFGVNR